MLLKILNILFSFLTLVAGIQNEQMRVPCPPGETGHIPYPGDCRRYVSCWRGRGVLLFCGPGTLFNYKTGRCDYPENVSCFTDDEQFDNKRNNREALTENPYYHRHNHHHAYHHHNHHNQEHVNNGDNSNPEARRFMPPLVVGQQPDGDRRFETRETAQFSGRRHHPAAYGLRPGHSHEWHSRQDPSYHGYQGNRNLHHHHHHHNPSTPENRPLSPRVNGQIPQWQPHPPTIGPQPRPASRPFSPSDTPRQVPLPLPPARTPTVIYPQKVPEYSTSAPAHEEIPFLETPKQDSEVINQDFDIEDCEKDEPPEPLIAAPSTVTETSAHYSPYSIPSEPLQQLDPPADDFSLRFGSERERCPQGFSGLLPHSDCTKFFSCANGRSFLMNCSPGTRFNPEKLICDYQEKVICHNLDFASSQNIPQSIPYSPAVTGHAVPPVVRPVVDNQPYKSATDADRGNLDFDIDVRFGYGGRISSEEKTKKHCKPKHVPSTRTWKPLFTPATSDLDEEAEPTNVHPVYQSHPDNPNIKGFFLQPKSENKNIDKNVRDQFLPQGNQFELPEKRYVPPEDKSKSNTWDVITAKPVIVSKPKTTQNSFSSTTPQPTTKSTVSYVFRPDLVISSRTGGNSSITSPDRQVLRLRGGSTQSEGFLEIQIEFNVWGVVCDQRNQWSLKEANLVCKNMGFSRGAERSWQGSSGKNARSMISASVIATNAVKCVGNEENFLECYISTGGNCELERDAIWVKCAPNPISACQPGEISHNGKCYSLVIPREDANDQELVGFSQGEALSHCQGRGAKLVDFNSQGENDFISEWLYREGTFVDKIMTSGVGTTIMGHSIWIWEGSSEPFKYTNWWPGWGGGKGMMPETRTGRALCVILQRMFPCQESAHGINSGEEQLCDAQYFYWTTEDCGSSSAKLPYICERPNDKIGCVVDDGYLYEGPANVTKKGNPCLHWDSEPVKDVLQKRIPEQKIRSALSGHNRCRNVDQTESHPWCYSISSEGITKELCDIPMCFQRVEKSGKYVDSVCKEDEFLCHDNKCIPATWVCDGESDCMDGGDELDCTKYLDNFKKHKGSRLYGHDINTIPLSDEVSCAKKCLETKSPQECRSFSFEASTTTCILSMSNIGLSGAVSKNDSGWEYYELSSLSIRCHEHFICSNGKCISRDLECNGHNDCGDGSDERNCSWIDYGIQLRLTGGKEENEGTIEIKVKNEWGLICDDEFDLSDGDVVCRQLGYPLGAQELHLGEQGNKSNLTKYLVDNLKCKGNESNIVECEHNGWGVHNCNPSEGAGVACKKDSKAECGFNYWQCKNVQECIPLHFLCDNVADCSDKSDENAEQCESPITVRLVGLSRSSKTEGRLEVRRFGVWGTVCDDDFGENEATVICNSLGLPGPVEVHKEAMFGAGDGIIWLDQVRCEGNESSVTQCMHEGWGQTNCRHNEDVSISCAGTINKPPEQDFAVDNYLGEGNKHPLPNICGQISPQINLPRSVSFKPKVVSGYETIKGTYPWQASVRVKSGSSRSAHWCGAVVITEFHVLTAAHCLRDYIKSHYLIRSGDFDTEVEEGTEQELEIDEVWLHPHFDQGGPRLNNDIAVVKVKSPGFQFNTWVLPACIPEAELPETNNCSISGWGTSGNPGSGFARTLHAAWISTLSNTECAVSKVYSEGAISEGMMCAGQGGSDSCQGDSGGPLLCLTDGIFHVHGITSWGHGCGRTNSPGVYTKVAHYRDWILQHIT